MVKCKNKNNCEYYDEDGYNCNYRGVEKCRHFKKISILMLFVIPIIFLLSLNMVSSAWTDGLSNGLVAYYPFSSGTDIKGLSNVTALDGSLQFTSTNCLIGNCMRTDTSHTAKIDPSLPVDFTGTYSFNMWFRTEAIINYGYIMGRGTEYDYAMGNANDGNNNLWIESSWGIPTMTGVINANQWNMITIIVNSNNVTAYFNGVYKSSSLSYGGGGGNTWRTCLGRRCKDSSPYIFTGNMDEVGYWSRTLSSSEVTQLYNSGSGITYIPPVSTSNTTVTLATYPNNNNYSDTSNPIFFNSTAIVTNGNFTNATLYVWDATSVYKTNTSAITGLPNNTGVNISLTGFIQGSYKWNVYYCVLNITNNPSCVSSVSNNTFTVDTTSPNLVIRYPLNSTYLLNTQNIVMNVSVGHDTTNIDSCWYSLNNGLTNISAYNYCHGNISTNLTLKFNATDGNKRYYIDFYSNDSLNNVGVTHSTFYLFNSTIAVSNEALSEGSNEYFSLTLDGINISSELAYTNATLKLNNINYLPDSITNFVDSIVIDKTLFYPIGTGTPSGNTSYYNWTYNLKNSTTLILNKTTETKSFKVYNMQITDCLLTSGHQILNLSLKDEELNTYINLTSPNSDTIEIDLQITSLTNSSIYWLFSKKWTNVNTAFVCIPNEVVNTTSFRIDFTIGYDATNYVRKFYYMDNGTLDNTSYFNSYTTNYIDLMDLLTVDSTTFLFAYTDENGLKVDNSIVHTYRKYIGDGVFREVERSKEDNNGQTHIHLVEEDVIYYFMITKYGNIVYTSDTYNAKCLSSPCSITLSKSSSGSNFSFSDGNIRNTYYKIGVDKNARNVTITQTSDQVVNSTFYLIRYVNSNPVLMNTSSLIAQNGMASFVIPNTYGNNSYFVSVWNNGEFYKAYPINLDQSARDIFGVFGVILAFFLLLSIVLMGFAEGIYLILLLFVGLVIVVLLTLVDLGWFALISIICAGGIIVFKYTRKKY